MKNIHVFIASSTENQPVAQALQDNISGHNAGNNIVIETQIWSKGIFGLGDTTIEALKEEAIKSDFAIFVFGNDSEVTERGQTSLAVRDNVVFEIGFFIGIIGRRRCFIVKGEKVKIPSDLIGITLATFKSPQTSNLENALSGPSTKIIEKIKNIYKNEPKAEHKQTLTDMYTSWWDKSNNARTQKSTIRTLEGFELTVSAGTFSPDIRMTYSPVIICNNLPKDLKGKKVLDLGTGCGILAISAAKRGATEVLAVDIDKNALNDADENIKMLEKKKIIPKGIIKLKESNLFSNVDGKYDFILTNLPISSEAEFWQGLGDPVIKIITNSVKSLDKHLNKDGTAFFSWASFGPPSLIPEILKDNDYSFKRYTEETFGVTWFVYQVQKKKKVSL